MKIKNTNTPTVQHLSFLYNTVYLSKPACTWICALFPAVMLDTVQQASFLMDSLGLLRRCSRHGSAEQFKIT